jgi:hypothetical protein
MATGLTRHAAKYPRSAQAVEVLNRDQNGATGRYRKWAVRLSLALHHTSITWSDLPLLDGHGLGATTTRISTEALRLMSSAYGSRDEFDRADVTALPVIAVAIDSTLTQLIPMRARRAVGSIDRRALSEEGYVPVPWCPVVHEISQ